MFVDYRVNSPNFRRLPNTGFMPLYTMVSLFAAFGHPLFSKHPKFCKFTLFRATIRDMIKDEEILYWMQSDQLRTVC